MSKIDWVTCEPFRAWNRLEPRTRKEDFDEVLQCAVHDPLWLLTRQWQFGEFKGEDAGSAIFSKLKIQTTQPGLYQSGNGSEPVEDYTNDIPAEVKVESEHGEQDYFTSVEAGTYFMKLLDVYFTKPALTPDYVRKDYYNQLRTLFPLQAPESIVPLDDHTKKVKKLKSLVNEPLTDLLATFGKRSFDGKALYESATVDTAPVVDALAFLPGHKTLLTAAINDFKGWYNKTYKPAHNSSGKGAWINEQLEYQFRFALPEKGGGNSVLLAEEYYTGDLEWYSFDVDQTNIAAGLKTTAIPTGGVTEKVISVIPTIAKYAGMPHPRWWQFEDGNVDLGNIDADTTDISKLIVSEYALMFSNDWLVVPYSLPAGSLTEVKGIVVTDVFGEKFYVEAATQGQTDNWNSWGLFNLSVRRPETLLPADNNANTTDTRLFLPPCVAKTMESEPIEEILFVRDEMANLVWAIETKINNRAGGYMDGHTFITHLKNALEGIEPPMGALPVDKDAVYKYTLENTVPENWIPFVPVHLPDNKRRAVRLQRASMPRWFMNEYAAVRPNTRLLRTGVNEQDGITAPFFINEEEVPRTGSKITTSFQRTRWYNGKVVNWVGKRKNMGRGEGSSGLQFDFLEVVRKKETAT